MQNIHLTDNPKLLKDLLLKQINFIHCPDCGEEFYYEHDCMALNSDKAYAVASLPFRKELNPGSRGGIFHILGKSGFRFRYVNEFIFLTEKVRIFEFDLDDRVLEVIKYKYIALPMKLGEKAKIILTAADVNSLTFTAFDDFDREISTHRVSSSAYFSESAKLQKEETDGIRTQWKKIDLKWAKENII